MATFTTGNMSGLWMSILRLSTGLVLLMGGLISSFACAGELPQFGYLERVRIGDNNILLKSKLDTGADTSSLGYQEIEYLQKDGADWVKVTVGNSKGESFTTLHKVIRVAMVRRHRASSIKRPVILVSLCLGGIQRTAGMSLADRSEFSTPILIGRNFLSGVAVVDPSREYTTEPNCKQGKTQ